MADFGETVAAESMPHESALRDSFAAVAVAGLIVRTAVAEYLPRFRWLSAGSVPGHRVVTVALELLRVLARRLAEQSGVPPSVAVGLLLRLSVVLSVGPEVFAAVSEPPIVHQNVPPRELYAKLAADCNAEGGFQGCSDRAKREIDPVRRYLPEISGGDCVAAVKTVVMIRADWQAERHKWADSAVARL